jgi:YggT family protein
MLAPSVSRYGCAMATTEVIVEREYYPAVFVARVVNTIIGIIEVLLVVRLLFELFGANAASPFIAWIYGMSGALMGPFANAFPAFQLGGASMLDVTAILAMIVYAVIGWLLVEILSLIFVSSA